MAVRVVLVLSLLLPAAAAAQERDAGEHLGYFDRCFGSAPRRPYGGGVGVYVPIGSSNGGSGASLPSIGTGGGDEKAWLIAAVVAVAALPVVLYAVDSPAPAQLRRRFECPTFSLALMGGGQSSRGELGNIVYGVSSSRFQFAYQHVATELDFDFSPNAQSSFGSRFVMRVDPRKHVSGGLSLGYRRSVFSGWVQDGFELGLPHLYSFWNDDGDPSVGLEIRPQLLITGGGIEPRLEGAFIAPFAEVFHLRVGGGVFTFGGSLFWTVQGGVSVTL